MLNRSGGFVKVLGGNGKTMNLRSRSVLVFVVTLAGLSLAGCGHLHGLLRSQSGPGANSVNPAGHSNGTTTTLSQATSSALYPNGISPAWLTSQAATWSSAPERPFILSPTLTGASYDNITKPGNSPAAIDNELTMLEDTGAQAITIDLGFDPWLSNDTQTISEDTSIINKIRASGRLVVIKDASAERYRKYPLAWDQFAQAWIERVKTIASLYHPDYYTLIKEPPWYAPMIAGLSRTDPTSPADRQVENVSTWTNLLSQLISTVKSVSPQTKVGIAVDGNLYANSVGDRFDLGLMKAATTMPGLDFLGFDLYTANAFLDTEQFLSQNGTGGKAIWINEAWSTTGLTSGSPTIQAQIDPQWANVLIDFAHTIGAQGVSPFFTDFFASYNLPPTTSNALVSFYNGRTSVFDAFQEYETSCHRRLSNPSPSSAC